MRTLSREHCNHIQWAPELLVNIHKNALNLEIIQSLTQALFSSMCKVVRFINPCMVFGFVGPVYYTLKTGPTDPNITQGLLNVFEH